MQLYRRCKQCAPALENFYNSLTDEQKERFNELGPKKPANQCPEASVKPAQAAETCKQPKKGLANLPIEKIEDATQSDRRAGERN